MSHASIIISGCVKLKTHGKN